MAKTIIFEDDFDAITFENESKSITLKDDYDTIVFDVSQISAYPYTYSFILS